MADTEFMSPEELAARKRKPLQEQLGGVAPAPAASTPSGMALTPGDRELSRKLLLDQSAPAAESGAPSPIEQAAGTRKEPSVPEVTPGSSPTSESQLGGVNNTVTETQAEVNSLLGRKPSARKLRDAVTAYEAAAGQLREQEADTTDIDAALARAKAGYEEKANRNEMLSLVQMIAQGFAKLAAYNYGSKHGTYIADQVNVPTVDYEKRTDRAFDELRLEQGEAEKLRGAAERKADRKYSADRDRAGSLKERIGAEETAFGRESAMYDAELAAARSRQSEASRDDRDDKRTSSLEEKFNRQFGAKEIDNVQQEEAILREKEQAVTALAGALSADDKRSRAAIPSLAAKAGVTPEEVEKFRADTEEKGIVFDSANPKAAADALSKSLLPGVRQRLDELRQRKERANEMMRTGESLEQVQARLSGAVPGADAPPPPSEKKPTADQIAKYKSMYPGVSDEQADKILTDRLNGR